MRALATVLAIAGIAAPPYEGGYQSRLRRAAERSSPPAPFENPPGSCSAELRATRKDRRAAKQRLRKRRGRR